MISSVGETASLFLRSLRMVKYDAQKEAWPAVKHCSIKFVQNVRKKWTGN
jgi:hypothetical protein